MKPQILDELCRQALANELGVRVETNHPKALRDHIDAFKVGVAEYAGLVVRSPPLPNLVFISKPTASLDD